MRIYEASVHTRKRSVNNESVLTIVCECHDHTNIQSVSKSISASRLSVRLLLYRHNGWKTLSSSLDCNPLFYVCESDINKALSIDFFHTRRKQNRRVTVTEIVINIDYRVNHLGICCIYQLMSIDYNNRNYDSDTQRYMQGLCFSHEKNNVNLESIF